MRNENAGDFQDKNKNEEPNGNFLLHFMVYRKIKILLLKSP
jgi:hypothetical protein